MKLKLGSISLAVASLLVYLFLSNSLSSNVERLPFDKSIQEPSWFAFGDLRGNVEPCGCDPLTDLGGIRRLVKFFQLEKSIHKDALIFNLGNSEKKGEESKNVLINHGLSKLNVDATLYNETELGGNSKTEEGVKRRYVLSNAKKAAEIPNHVAHSITRQNSIVFGFVEPSEKSDLLRELSSDTCDEWHEEASKAGRDKYRFLLFRGGEKSLSAAVTCGLFHQIILSNSQPYNADFDHREKNNPQTLLKISGGKKYYEVPLGGLGVIRGGSAKGREAPFLSKLFKDKDCNQSFFQGEGSCGNLEPSPQISGSKGYPITWLVKDYQDEKVLLSQFTEFRDAVGLHYDRIIASKLKDLADSKYVGSETCKNCHSQEYRIWKESTHAKAWQTLKYSGSERNAECVQCHVVGFDKKGGFAGMKASKHLANVQCENCHGPRKEHATNPSVRPVHEPAAKKVCSSCHKGAHSPNFSYDVYWPKIKHGRL